MKKLPSFSSPVYNKLAYFHVLTIILTFMCVCRFICLWNCLIGKNSFIIPLFFFEYHRKHVHTSISCAFAWAMIQTNEFCQTTAKFIPLFHVSFSPLILLHLRLQSSFILKLSVGCQSSPKTKSKPSNAIKSKDHVRWVCLPMENVVLLIPNGL